MSFNRIKYDGCAYDLKMDRSTQPGDYRLYANYAENCDQCFSFDGPVGAKSDVSLVRNNDDLTFTNMADVESSLSWRRQKLTECNDPLDNLDQDKLVHKKTCTSKLVAEDTRFTNPLDNYRAMSLTSYMVSPYLPVNPQCIIQPNYDKTGLNSRLYVKDTYKQSPQNAWDNGEALPKDEDPSNNLIGESQLVPVTVYAKPNGNGYDLNSQCITGSTLASNCLVNNKQKYV